jgi:hypothetical protein
LAVDLEGAEVLVGDVAYQAVAVAGFGAGENIGMAWMPALAVAGDGEAV